MGKLKSAKGIGRREALRKLVTGAGASAALPSLAKASGASHVAMPAMPAQQALGSAEPPDSSLTSPDWKPKFFDAHQNETLVVLSDLIIPETDTPGAKAAQVNRFIDLLLNASPPDVQKEYLEALGWLDGYCLSLYSKPFTQIGGGPQTSVLTLLTHPNDDPKMAYGVELFKVIKDSVVQAYYSSEPGLLQELKYQTNPYQPEFPACRKDH